jgi:hypothetical protein
MFELGLRQAFDKPVVLVQEVGTPPIFDITPLRYTEYHKEMLYRQVLEDQEEIAKAIIATNEALGDSKSVNSIVKLLSLTHGASLATISEADREPALLQVIMTELANIRSEIRHAGDNKIKPNISNQGTISSPLRSKSKSPYWRVKEDIQTLESTVQRHKEFPDLPKPEEFPSLINHTKDRLYTTMRIVELDDANLTEAKQLEKDLNKLLEEYEALPQQQSPSDLTNPKEGEAIP